MLYCIGFYINIDYSFIDIQLRNKLIFLGSICLMFHDISRLYLLTFAFFAISTKRNPQFVCTLLNERIVKLCVDMRLPKHQKNIKYQDTFEHAVHLPGNPLNPQSLPNEVIPTISYLSMS